MPRYTKAQKRAYAKRMARLRRVKRRRRFKKRTRFYNGGGNLKMLRNPLHVRKSCTLRQTYVNSCIVPSQTFSNTNMNLSIGFFLNSAFIFQNQLGNVGNIVWSAAVNDTFSGNSVPDSLDSYNAGDNWGYKYKTAQVLGTTFEINVRCLRDTGDGTDTSVCPVAVSFVKQTMPGLHSSLTPEIVRNRPYTITKLVNTDGKENSADVGFKIKHSPAKFNNVSKNFLGNSLYSFSTGNSTSGNGPSPGIPSELDWGYLVISPACSAMVNQAIGRTNSPQLMISIKRTSYVKYTEPNMSDNQPQPIYHI